MNDCKVVRPTVRFNADGELAQRVFLESLLTHQLVAWMIPVVYTLTLNSSAVNRHLS
jgi:hypothetical protein